MTHKLAIAFAAVAALSATAPAFAGPQSTDGLDLNQIAAVNYNKGKSPQDQQAVFPPNSGSPEIEAFAIANYNSGKSRTDIQTQVPDTSAVAATRAAGSNPADHSQLIASAGLTAEQAEGLTLNEIAAAKYNRGRSVQDQQGAVNGY